MTHTTLQKVLIANRGEIAVRVANACTDLGIRTVAIYAEADADALHVVSADEAYVLRGVTPSDTYLDQHQILEIARTAGCDAVHPGYGFLSESGDFAEAVAAAGLRWIGPSAQVIRLLGDKLSAREVALATGAPLVPGSDGPVTSADEVREFAGLHGLPVIVKAAFGGGGRGMKIVREFDEIDEAFESAGREAHLAFGRSECFVEKFLERPRHIEAQVIADDHGNVIVVGTRDCTLQRRNQKLIEEAPAPFLTDEQRERIESSAREIFRRVEYVGAGTVEYLLDQHGTLSFLEVNTRLQVEHPVTEETSGIDLVAAQLSVAAGERLDPEMVTQPRLHAFEFRINAEDPGRGFLPSPGVITSVRWPTGLGIRVDAGVTSGSRVPDQFDSLIAKLIVTGRTREQAIRRARRALQSCEIEGIATVLPFHQLMLEQEAFTSDTNFGVHTTWIESELGASLEQNEQFSPYGSSEVRRTISIELDGRRVELGLPESLLSGFSAAQFMDGAAVAADRNAAEVTDAAGVAPAPGVLVKWLVEIGDEVQSGDSLAVLEVMKMETKVFATRDGWIQAKLVEPGTVVAAGDKLATFTAD